MTSTDKIKQMVIDAFSNERDSKKINNFIFRERISAGIYHEGKLKYCQQKIYELKSEGLKKHGFSFVWVRHECPSIFSINVIDSLIKFYLRVFVEELEHGCDSLNKGRYKSEITLKDIFADAYSYINDSLSGFFELAFKIKALEELTNEVEAIPFLTSNQIAELNKHTGVIWDCPDLATLEKVFDFNNTQKQDFKIKHNNQLKFYKILREIYEKNNRGDVTQEILLKPFIERYDLNWNTFLKRAHKNDIV